MAHRVKRAEDAWLRWHASKLLATTSCPLRGFNEFVLALHGLTNPYGALGQSLHYLFKQFFTQHPSTKRFPYEESEKLKGIWFTFWWSAVAGSTDDPALLKPWTRWVDDRQAEKEARGLKPFRPPKPHGFGGWGEDPYPVDWHEASPANMYYSGVGILQKFHNHFVEMRHDGVRRLLERRFTVVWEGFQLTGILDRIDVEPDGAIIYDYKSHFFQQYKEETDVQMTLYQLGYELGMRKNIPGQPPLKAIRIFNYKHAKYQEIPLRDRHEYGMLLAYLHEASTYYRAVLLGQPPAAGFSPKFRVFNWDDVRRSDVSPALPRADHCKFCRYFRECRAWERGELPSAQEQFRARYREYALAADERRTQPQLDFGDDPVIRQGLRGASALHHSMAQFQFSLPFGDPPKEEEKS